MRRQKTFSGGFRSLLFNNLFAIILFVLVAVILFQGLQNTTLHSREEEKRVLEESIRRAVVSCYAIEGSYPASFEELKNTYGLQVNENRFIVEYEIFASNIVPTITVLERT